MQLTDNFWLTFVRFVEYAQVDMMYRLPCCSNLFVALLINCQAASLLNLSTAKQIENIPKYIIIQKYVVIVVLNQDIDCFMAVV